MRERVCVCERESVCVSVCLCVCISPLGELALQTLFERWGAGVEYHFQEFNEPYAPS